MNAVEIEQAITELAEQTFDSTDFPYQFLAAFGNKLTTLNRLRSGTSNSSDISREDIHAVLQRNNIHIAVCPKGEVSKTLLSLKASPATAKSKAKIILATDGFHMEAEDVASGETVACDYQNFPNHFGFFLTLAGITTVKQIRNNPVDIQATGRLNRLYVELLSINEEWALDAHRDDMNHFMTRLIFCFFAEDTDIFNGDDLFTATVERMSDSRSGNVAEVISEIFRAMNTPLKERSTAQLPRWADAFPYVNGGLFSGSCDTPKFSRIARSYLLHAGSLNWKEINPDIFGSMIQAVANDDERGELGMHYTSVPNILKVLNPLFLDSLREQLEQAGDNARKLLNLKKRIAKIRVFDPACGSGNFLVIAYKEMRAIEQEITRRRKDADQKSVIPLTNFRGIELNYFPAEIARLALIIAEYQCDVLYRGQKDALAEFLPLDAKNWITCGNALRLDWLSICPPTGKAMKRLAEDLFETIDEQIDIDFENEGGETYICGNPPYLGSTWQSKQQKADLEHVFSHRTKSWKSLDYVAGWFMRAADYGTHTNAASAFVSTNSICQGQQVPILWPLIFNSGHEIFFAHTSFKWANLASHNAGVTVVIVGISNHAKLQRKLFSPAIDGQASAKSTKQINAYLVSGQNISVARVPSAITGKAEMIRGNMPYDGGNLLLSTEEVTALGLTPEQKDQFIRRIYGSAEFIRGIERYCLWIEDKKLLEAMNIEPIRLRIEAVRAMRLASRDKSANKLAERSHQFREMNIGKQHSLVLPIVSSESREHLPIGLLDSRSCVTNLAFALYDAPLWSLALIASRIHLVWIKTVCGQLETRIRYSNTLGWNTFPLPTLTQKNKQDLTRCAEDILLARETHFPATIADLYKPDAMPENLRRAHDRNDEALERIYIGRRFNNDSERLEKLFAMYTKMTADKTN